MSAATAQVLPEEIELPQRALDLRGQVFGMLTALRPVGNNQYGVHWLCECECGRHAIRSAAKLREGAKEQVEQQCAECARELRGGWLRAFADQRHDLHLLRWYQHESLYTHRQLEAIKRRIIGDLRAAGIPVGEPPPDLLDDHGYEQPERDLIAYTITDGRAHTLEEVADAFDVTRERIRQISLRAMEKLKVRHRRLLWALLTGEELHWQWGGSKAPIDEDTPPLPRDFVGCSCKSYARSIPGHIYCRWCGQVWRVDENVEKRVMIDALFRKVTVEDEPEDESQPKQPEPELQPESIDELPEAARQLLALPWVTDPRKR